MDIVGLSAIVDEISTEVINPWKPIAGWYEEIDVAVQQRGTQGVEVFVQTAKGRFVVLTKVGDYLLDQLSREMGEGCHVGGEFGDAEKQTVQVREESEQDGDGSAQPRLQHQHTHVCAAWRRVWSS